MKQKFIATVKLPNGDEKVFTRSSEKDYKGFYYGIASTPDGQTYTKHGFFTGQPPIQVGSKYIWPDCRFHIVLTVPATAE